MNMDFNISSDRLINFIKDATCSFTTIQTAASLLLENGFKELKRTENWKLKKGGKYFVNIYDSSLMAFTIGKKYNDGMLKIVSSHTDSPAFSVKPNPEMKAPMAKMGKLNVDGYGGAILNTWLDRPLSVAVRASVKSSDVFNPEVKIVDFKEACLVIPNLAIHMNNTVNKGVELNKQVDMLPVYGIFGEENEDFFMDYLAKKLEVNKEDILDFEGYVYNTQAGEYVGINKDMLLCPRLDNATSVVACLEGIMAPETLKGEGINVAMLFDNEEIGSMTKQGANSSILTFLLEKIYLSLHDKNTDAHNRSGYINTVLNGMMISLDVAHATHPNHAEKNDPTNSIVLNAGPVIKRSASQRYATDSRAIGVIEQICKQADIPYQKFAIRSDMVGGSTLGPISDIQLPMHTVDIGIPMLAMHSACETMGAKDQAYIEELVKKFYSSV